MNDPAPHASSDRRGRWRQRGYFIAGGVLLLILPGTLAISTWTVTTRQGINSRVSTREIPFYVKIMDFFHRHYKYEAFTAEITPGLNSDRERVLAVFDWTRRNIRKTLEDGPVVDDHVLNIIIRGHGLDDQMADVFTTLSTYAGVPAFWSFLALPGSKEKLVLSFARVDGRWVVFDVANGVIFQKDRGDLASVEEIAANPGLVEGAAGALRYLGVPYQRYFQGFTPPSVPNTLRAEKQMPWRRLIFEAKRLLG